MTGRRTTRPWARSRLYGTADRQGSRNEATPRAPAMSEGSATLAGRLDLPRYGGFCQSGPATATSSRPAGAQSQHPWRWGPGNKPLAADLSTETDSKRWCIGLLGRRYRRVRLAGRPGDMSRAAKAAGQTASLVLGRTSPSACRPDPECGIEPFCFAMGSAAVPERAQRDLTELSTGSSICGWRDTPIRRGLGETNEELGTARAHAVAALQAGLKVSTQVEVVGRGGCCFMPNHADSRRVEITMLLRNGCANPSSVEERSQTPQ